jgi:hypothetical protein
VEDQHVEGPARGASLTLVMPWRGSCKLARGCRRAYGDKRRIETRERRFMVYLAQFHGHTRSVFHFRNNGQKST